MSLMSFEWYLLRIMVFLLWRRDAENIKKENKTDKKNTEK